MTTDLKRRISEGTLDTRRVAFAAALGCQRAIETGVTPTVLDDHYRSLIEQVAAYLTHRESITFACECAERALRGWESLFPSDRRPRSAVEAVRSWLLKGETPAEIKTLGSAAAQAEVDADFPELTEDVDPAHCAAMAAASACSHAALALEKFRLFRF